MFCSKCGAEIDDNAQFCSVCGNTISSASQSWNSASNLKIQKSTRAETESVINELINYFSIKSDLYQEFDKNELKLYKTKQVNALKVITCILICTIVFSFAWFIIISQISGNEIVLITASSICAIIVLAIILIIRTKKIKKLTNRQNEIISKISDYYYQLEYCPIGIEYSDPAILNQLMAIVKTGRADTIKEAINIMLDDAHKNQMENAAFLAAQSAYQTAKNSRVAAVAGVINLFKK